MIDNNKFEQPAFEAILMTMNDESPSTIANNSLIKANKIIENINNNESENI